MDSALAMVRESNRAPFGPFILLIAAPDFDLRLPEYRLDDGYSSKRQRYSGALIELRVHARGRPSFHRDSTRRIASQRLQQQWATWGPISRSSRTPFLKELLD